jgi:hypothetical protein
MSQIVTIICCALGTYERLCNMGTEKNSVEVVHKLYYSPNIVNMIKVIGIREGCIRCMTEIMNLSITLLKNLMRILDGGSLRRRLE